ncbi:MAG TPA: TraB/GumN family protein [Flavisolibacter sp.]|jgi:uncharacterized protein YbaP (TraB family)|nr:TraB/GumN family protein [Flavisolibacter sp.]
MRTLLTLAFAVLLTSSLFSQTPKLKSSKYQGLLWEISGKGLTRPSYLFGTMHVSNKMVFHLPDSFYLAIRNADVVALETNPGTWQEDFSRYDMEGSNIYSGYRGSGYASPSDYLSINSLKVFPYEKLMEQALYSSPSIINSFLYRTNSDQSSEFEEDTYLDLYIYQVGRKWNKKVCGVENFDESMTLMKDAYLAGAKDKNKKERSYDDNDFSYSKLEDAYRTGNLDLLDTINKVNSTSAAFDEKFLYKRNEIQARSIDSILKTKAALFVGVGAAHLPGHRGVIELLRREGYKLRPVKMGERDSRHKDDIEKIRVPVTFSRQTAKDGFYTVDLPGKLYSFTSGSGPVDQAQYADMSNGSYYMVSRIQTNASLWGHSLSDVQRKVDSVLYENIPGKILSKQIITKNGYKGFDIVNKTRRGDYQHYNIFITPFEVILFKVSGNGEYVKDSKEAASFFNSIQLKEIKADWKKFSPSFGGFEVELPHDPVVKNRSSQTWLAFDPESQTAFQVIRTDVHNLKFAEEDSFDLNLMEESFGSSEFIDKQLTRRQTRYQAYPALDARYRYKDGSQALVRFLIQGPHYYTLIANGKKETPQMTRFLNSFSLKPLRYGPSRQQTDTTLFFSVSSPVLVNEEKKLEMFPSGLYQNANEDEDSYLEDNGVYKDKLIANDTTGEKIYVMFYKPSRYYYETDSTVQEDSTFFRTEDQDWTFRKSKRSELKGMKVFDYEMGDPKSSRIIKGKTISRNGVWYNLATELDSLSQPSAFITGFFDSFQPSDTVTGINVREKKSGLFFKEFFSADTLQHKKALKNLSTVKFDSTDFAPLSKAIRSLTWKEKKYLDLKNAMISKLGDMPSTESALFLRDLYYAAGDTVEMQYRALESLLQQETAFSYQTFRDIMLNEPPVLNISGSDEDRSASIYSRASYRDYDEDDDYSDGDFMDNLTDSLALTRTIFKDLLPLININDYEKPLMGLLETMVDSSMITYKEYDMYLPKLLIEARQEMKKQVINEKNRSIEKAQKEASDKEDDDTESRKDYGNSRLSSYATLLMPFWETNAAVPPLLRQMLNSNDKRLRYNTAMLFLRNGKPVPDSILNGFAATDDYRYELYKDLEELKALSRFPTAYNKQVDLARSELLEANNYNKPDSIVYLDKLPLQYQSRNGYVYFFKYRQNKNDNSWKLGTVGILPADQKAYRFPGTLTPKEKVSYDFTDLTGQKLKEDEPLKDQLQKLLKKAIYKKRKSAARFYNGEDRYDERMGLFDVRD